MTIHKRPHDMRVRNGLGGGFLVLWIASIVLGGGVFFLLTWGLTILSGFAWLVVLARSVGGLIGGAIWIPLQVLDVHVQVFSQYIPLGLLAAGAASGAAMGLGQWLVLRGWLSK